MCFSVKAQEPSKNEKINAYCRFVPERDDDFAWENNRVAFRMYGPEGQEKAEKGIGVISSGIDCWFKRVDYPIIDSWYQKPFNGGSFHKDDGEGLDCYHVGVGRGCGGTAILYKGKYYVSNNFVKYEIIENGPDKVVFKLFFAPIVIDGKDVTETKTITLKKDDMYFRCDVEFETELKLETLASGISLHGGKGETNYSKDGWIAYWEPMQDSELGTAVWSKKRDYLGNNKQENVGKDLDNFWLHLKIRKNRATFYAGFSWKKAGFHSTFEEWLDYVSENRK